MWIDSVSCKDYCNIPEEKNRSRGSKYNLITGINKKYNVSIKYIIMSIFFNSE